VGLSAMDIKEIGNTEKKAMGASGLKFEKVEKKGGRKPIFRQWGVHKGNQTAYEKGAEGEMYGKAGGFSEKVRKKSYDGPHLGKVH